MTSERPAGAEATRAPELSVIVPTFNERDNVGPLFDKLAVALAGIAYEVIVVDDDSADGTAEAVKAIARTRPEIRCLHRVGRRGLSSAVIEGIGASGAPYVAVIDADHQHDETILPEMLARLRAGADIAVGTRYDGTGSSSEGFTTRRQIASTIATRLAGILTGKQLTDPMSGFFMLQRPLFVSLAPRLSREGFKVLLDVIVAARGILGRDPVIAEVPYGFRARHAGESKMSALIGVQFLGLILSRLSMGLLPTTFLLFSLVGATGVVVHMSVLTLAFGPLGFNFANAQVAATLVAMTTNFILNNELTYADKKLRGRNFWIGILTFYVVCSFGTLANVSVASILFEARWTNFFNAGIAGAVMSVVFNYAVTRVFTWRQS